MGYSHYWYRPQELDETRFNSFSTDVRKIINYVQTELQIDLADGSGSNEPIINNDFISLNGSDSQRPGPWTICESIGLAWPSDEAGIEETIPDPVANPITGTWCAGPEVDRRTCPINNTTGFGAGSYESFLIQRTKELHEYCTVYEGNLYFECLKTNYHPYDIAVNACLVAFKHHFPECVIRTDGQLKDWFEGKTICFNLFGYGLDFAPADKSPKEKQKESTNRYKFQGSNYNSKLSTSDICKIVKKQLKKEFPKCIFSLRKDGGSYTSSIYCSLMAGPFQALNFEKLSDYEKKSMYIQVNHYHIEDSERLTEEGKKVLKRAYDLLSSYNFDDSDSMTDYFHCNYYLHFNVGQFHKPYIFIESKAKPEPVNQVPAPAEIDINLTSKKDQIEITFSKKPDSNIIAELKNNGFWYYYKKRTWTAKFTVIRWNFVQGLV